MKMTINIVVILFFLCTLVFNFGLIDIRFFEINYLLGKAAFANDGLNALGIITKYELIKRRIEHGENNDGNYALEARMQALLSGDQFSSESHEINRKKLYLIPVRIVLNGMRLALGKEMIHPKAENKIFKVLEIAYFWERNRKYLEAIKMYDDILVMDELSPSVHSAVLLHKAFCHSMLSEYQKSKQIYEEIINLFSQTESGVLSWKLLEFINSIEEKRKEVKTADLSNFERAKKYYLIMDYRNSIKFYSRFLQDHGPNTFRAEGRYFKGRSHEELGEIEEAVLEYRLTTKIDTSGIWTREANRRIVMLGEFYNYKKKMTEEAKRQLTEYKDGDFLRKVNKFKKMMSTSSIRDELMQTYDKENKKTGNSDITDLINSIGEIDLVGDTSASKRDKFPIKQSQKGTSGVGSHSQDENQKHQYTQALTNNPYRRPSFIKKTIVKNVYQLHLIYNKKLKSGIELSGKMLMEITILPNGQVGSTKIVNSNMGYRMFEEEIVDKISTWQFKPIPDSLGVLTIRYPFEFYRED